MKLNPMLKRQIVNRAPIVLTALTALGVILTAVSASNATKKAAEEPEDEQWKCYIPTVVIGSATIACIAGSQYLNYKQQQTLVSAYCFLNSAFMDYKRKVIEHYGMEEHNRILDELRVEQAEKRYFTVNDPFIGNITDPDFFDEDEQVKLCYDVFSKRYFEAKPSDVLQAEYHFNRNYILGCDLTVNDWYHFLGLEPIEDGDAMYVDLECGLGWIDFEHYKTVMDDGLECWSIDMITSFGPPEDG